MKKEMPGVFSQLPLFFRSKKPGLQKGTERKALFCSCSTGGKKPPVYCEWHSF